MYSNRKLALLISVVVLAGACDSNQVLEPDAAFLEGTADNPQIGFVVNSLGRSLTAFQLGNPAEVRHVPFGASHEITPTGLAIRGRYAVVPLGNAASVALVDLRRQRTERFFLFAGGNASGSAFADDSTVLVANLDRDQVGRFALRQESSTIEQLAEVAPKPSAIVVVPNRALVVSANLDESWAPIGNGIVTALNPTTLAVLGTVATGGPNSQAAALGADGRLYVVDSGDYVGAGSLSIIDPVSLSLLAVHALPPGPGSISIDAAGLAYISGFFFGTVIWNTATNSWVRGPQDPICAPLPSGACRGAFDAESDAAGNLYQVFFGSPAEGLAPQVFVYRAGDYQLTDSIATGMGPTALVIREF